MRKREKIQAVLWKSEKVRDIEARKPEMLIRSAEETGKEKECLLK